MPPWEKQLLGNEGRAFTGVAQRDSHRRVEQGKKQQDQTLSFDFLIKIWWRKSETFRVGDKGTDRCKKKE